MFGFQPIPFGRVVAAGGPTGSDFGSVGATWLASLMLGQPSFNSSGNLGRNNSAFSFFNATWHWDEVAVFRLAPNAATGYSGLPADATPGLADLSLTIGTNAVNASYPFDVVLKGLDGGVSTPPLDSAILSSLTTAETLPQGVTSASSGSLTFDITAILAEMAADATWDSTRDVYIVAIIDSVTANMGSGFPPESSRITFTDVSLDHDI